MPTERKRHCRKLLTPQAIRGLNRVVVVEQNRHCRMPNGFTSELTSESCFRRGRASVCAPESCSRARAFAFCGSLSLGKLLTGGRGWRGKELMRQRHVAQLFFNLCPGLLFEQ